MVRTGLREVIGSWKIMPILLPLTFRISDSEICKRSLPSNSTSPPSIRPGGLGINRMIDRAETLLPQPLSPTRPSVSPSWM